MADKKERFILHLSPCTHCCGDVDFCSDLYENEVQVECQDCGSSGPRVWPDGEFEDLDEDELNKPEHNGYEPAAKEAARLWNELQRQISRGQLEEMRDVYQDIPHAESKKTKSRRL